MMKIGLMGYGKAGKAVANVLANDPRAPHDLRQKSLRLAGRILEFDPDVRGGDGFAIARDILESGRAMAKMRAIIDAQGHKPFDPDHPALAPLSFEVLAKRDGIVSGIDNQQVARLARLAGAPKVQGAGVDLLFKLGDTVKEGQPLYRVYAAYSSDLEFARQASERNAGYYLGEAGAETRQFVEF